jgi:hypothetical protein
VLYFQHAEFRGRRGGEEVSSEAPEQTAFSEERAELEAVLAWDGFARAPTRARLLAYVCRKYFEGEAKHIKEYNIAVEALGRPAEFDAEADPIVRVEAHRLRKRLKQYYEGEGAGHRIQIHIPPGSYVPHFIRTEPAERLQALPSVTTVAAIPPPVGPSIGRRIARWPAALALVVLVGAALMIRAIRGGSHGVPLDPFFSGGNETRILAGAPDSRYVDRLGHLWLGDRFFTGGAAVASPGQAVQRTPDPVLYQARREGEFRYDIPLKPGVYELRLYFAETVYGAGKTRAGGESSRLFTVSVNGRAELAGFDIVSDAGGSDIADLKIFKDISPAGDGALHLQFQGEHSAALLNAIEILPAAEGRSWPIRVVAQEGLYGDTQGRVWCGDRFFQGGQPVMRTVHVRGAADPGIYRGERYGNFTYTIPVASGRHTIRLHFAETYFGPTKPGGGGVGSRVFDVYCNGVALLRAFDIYKAAGAADVSVDREFPGVEPNAQGKFVLSFVPVRNYACVNAIEVL